MDTMKNKVGVRTIIDSQREAALHTTSITILTGSILNLVGLVGYPDFHISNIVFICITLLTSVLTRLKVLKPIAACNFVLFLASSDVLGEMMFIAFKGLTDSAFQILCECIVFTSIICMAAFAYLRMLVNLSLAAWTITYAICCYITHNCLLLNTGGLIMVIYIFVMYLSIKMHHTVRKIIAKNTELQNDENELLDFFKMDKKQLLSYIRLAQDRNLSEEETQNLLSSLNVESSVTISQNVAYMMRQQEIEYSKMKERMPELTPSELEIARLILQEKKQTEIVKLTGKHKGNITVQRSKIRKKLNLPKDESLYEGLKNRMTN